MKIRTVGTELFHADRERDKQADLQTNLHFNVLMANEMHNSYNQFLFHSFFVCSTCFERI